MATAAEIQTAYRALYRVDLNATTAAAIAGSGISVDAYIAGQLPNVASTTQAGVAIASFVTGIAPDSAKLDALKPAADAQVASYTALGVANPALGAYEAFGRGFATDPTTTAGFVSKYGALSSADFVNVVYGQVYGATPTAGAFANLSAQITYFTNLFTVNNVPNAAIAAKGAVLGQIVGYAFISSASANSSLDNQVASFLTSAAKGDATVYGKALPVVVDPGSVGVTISLSAASNEVSPTAGDPALKSTVNNDTINGSTAVNVGAGQTLGDATKINAGAGDDVLNVTAIDVTVYAPTAGSLNSVETINYKSFAGSGLTLTNVSGLKAVNLDAGSAAGAVTFTDVAQDATVGIKATAAANLSLDYTGTNTATTSNLTVSSLYTGAVTFNDTSVKTVNVTTSGTASSLAFGNNQIETITVKGAGTYTQGTTGTALKVFDASGATGAVTVDLSATVLTNKATFTLGAGSDTISIQSNKGHTVTLGGGNDTFSVKLDSGAGNVDATTNATLTANLLSVTDAFANSGKETLNFDGMAGATRTVLSQTQLDNAAAAADLKAAATLVGNVTTDIGAVDHLAFFKFGADTYAYYDVGHNGLNAGDSLVKLTGVDLSTQLFFSGATQNVNLV